MTSRQKPKVSVIMGVYNCEDTLAESIESILSQTYKNWELIICDDASSDRTYEIARQYADHYSDKIRLIRNKKNKRLAASLNHCLQYAGGKYIARQDGDDISLPRRFEKQVAFLETQSHYQVVGSGMIAFDENGVRGVRMMPPSPAPRIMAKGTPFCHATIMMRAEAYQALKGYRVGRRTRRMEDIDLWLRFFEAGYRGYNLQEALYKVREDESAFKRRKLSYSIDNAFIVYDACRRLKLPLSDYAYILKPIIRGLMPPFIMNKYHKKRLMNEGGGVVKHE
ncbi:glycosyltransferase family 2 protein [Bacillus sonorensis]|uniref:Glycosyltransferase EpsE n=2 Tax=Bacillus sonorensis TaxID=119858 RepID=M5PBT3_9BACI|nr:MULTISPECIES: glycosyltransferase family 2 protein [Bacillus]TWK79534.1 putative glycosyltransferase EpsE [Bacillus paralicheniformis]ASB87264.1 Putative glycosyltransferase EpsE [Bacillus sonorensis]EME73255.1 glycosyltransferase EpsE [Bacillus sonorensis L12]MBG9914248.1 glycosyl transferase [Bacillus sonorensis]MCF7616510.1 glycosyltransferase [Bacillus sonorensis]